MYPILSFGQTAYIDLNTTFLSFYKCSVVDGFKSETYPNAYFNPRSIKSNLGAAVILVNKKGQLIKLGYYSQTRESKTPTVIEPEIVLGYTKTSPTFTVKSINLEFGKISYIKNGALVASFGMHINTYNKSENSEIDYMLNPYEANYLNPNLYSLKILHKINFTPSVGISYLYELTKHINLSFSANLFAFFQQEAIETETFYVDDDYVTKDADSLIDTATRKTTLNGKFGEIKLGFTFQLFRKS